MLNRAKLYPNATVNYKRLSCRRFLRAYEEKDFVSIKEKASRISALVSNVRSGSADNSLGVFLEGEFFGEIYFKHVVEVLTDGFLKIDYFSLNEATDACFIDLLGGRLSGEDNLGMLDEIDDDLCCIRKDYTLSEGREGLDENSFRALRHARFLSSFRGYLQEVAVEEVNNRYKTLVDAGLLV